MQLITIAMYLTPTLGYSLCFFSKIGLFFKMLIAQRIFVGINSNFLHSIRASIQYVSENVIKIGDDFGAIFWKTMGYSLCFFSKIGPFLRMFIAQKFFVGIGSNFLHSIRASIQYVSENVIKIGDDFGAIFWKTMGYNLCFFSKIGPFLRMFIAQKFFVGIGSNFLHSIRTLICDRIWENQSLSANSKPDKKK